MEVRDAVLTLENEVGRFQQSAEMINRLMTFGHTPAQVDQIVSVAPVPERMVTLIDPKVEGVVQSHVQGSWAIGRALSDAPGPLLVTALEHHLDQGEQCRLRRLRRLRDVVSVVGHHVGDDDAGKGILDVIQGEHPALLVEHLRFQFSEQVPDTTAGPEAHGAGQEDALPERGQRVVQGGRHDAVDDVAEMESSLASFQFWNHHLASWTWPVPASPNNLAHLA